MNKSLLESLSFLRSNEQTMIAQLHQFCAINSGSDNLPGLSIMLNALHEAFTPIADKIESHRVTPIPTISMTGDTVLQTCGDVLHISKRPDLKRRILLSGHMDTVYGPNHPFQTLTYINENHVAGPGVADMKGGLIVMLHALSAFEKTAYATFLGWDVVINADEEIGSSASIALLAQIATACQTALVYEPAMNIDGSVAKNRKGSGKITLVATGKAAHAGRAFAEGRNAICHLAEAISSIHALNGLRDGVTINIGNIAGGEALNVVPDKAVAKLDIRFSNPDDEFWVQQQITNILSKMKRDGYSLTMHAHFGRPVKHIDTATQQLFKRTQRLGLELGLTIDWQDSGGCCDGNNLASYGLPVLDTLGVRGGLLHSANEFILLDSLVERAALSMLLLADIAQHDLTGPMQ